MGRRENQEESYHMPRKFARKQYRSDSERSDDSDHFSDTRTKHGCTDILCTLLFLIFISVLVAVSIFAYKNGNYWTRFNAVEPKLKI